MWFWITVLLVVFGAVLVELWAGWFVGSIMKKMDGPL